MTTIQKIASQISPYMEKQGYKLSKNCFYKIQDDMALCVQFDCPGGFVYATFFVMPLYIPCQNRYYTYGNRVNSLRHSKTQPLSADSSDDAITKWCKILCRDLETIVFLFFREIATPKQLITAVEKKRYLAGPFFSCPDVQVFRLLMFSYLYTEKFEKLSLTIADYLQIIQNSTFLTKPVRDQYSHEAEAVQVLAQGNIQDCRDFCIHTIANTLSTLQL